MGNEVDDDTVIEETVNTTDNDILSSIGELDDEPASGEGTGTETNASSEGTTAGASTTDNKQGAGEGANTQQEVKKAAGPQDLVDKDGNVIAAGGKERRFYETAQREKFRADKVTKEFSDLKAQYDAIQATGTLGSQYNLTPDELTTGAQIIAAYKDNPVDTLKYLLTQAQAAGHNIDGLMGNALNPDSIKLMIDKALAPIMQERTEKSNYEAVQNRALEIYNEFNSKYPDAAPHENSLARLLEAEPSLSPEAAYYKLKSYYATNGLDWTKSLEQLQAAAQQQQPVQQPTRVVTPTTQPMPNGVSSRNVTGNSQVADVNVSFDDIIRQAMNEAGIN